MGYHEDRFIEYLGEQDGQLGASPGDALRRLSPLHRAIAGRGQAPPNGNDLFHAHTWQDGPPPDWANQHNEAIGFSIRSHQ